MKRMSHQVYLMGDPTRDQYKIGYSYNARLSISRVKNYMGFPVTLLATVDCECLEVAQLVEHRLHVHFLDRRIEREKFRNVTVDEFRTVGNLIEKETATRWQQFGQKMFRGYSLGILALNSLQRCATTEPPLQGVSGCGGVCKGVQGSRLKRWENSLESTNELLPDLLPDGSDPEGKV
jgi:hypothetical protein